MSKDPFVYDPGYHLDNNYISNPITFGDVSLYQIGRLYSQKDTVVNAHLHGNLYELTVVSDGKGIITTNGMPLSVDRGDIYISFPCDTHKIESDSENNLKYDFFAFNTDNQELKKELERISVEHRSADSRVFRDERVADLVSNAISEFGSDNLFSFELLTNIFRQIIIYTVRSFGEVSSEQKNRHLNSNEMLCYKLMNYIDTHIYSMKSLEELSDATGYSYGYLSALYKKTTGSTVMEYYTDKRMEISRILIAERHHKIKEIAEILGYSSVYSFSKAFKNRFGESPEAYQKGRI